jgi:hypothetical protein
MISADSLMSSSLAKFCVVVSYLHFCIVVGSNNKSSMIRLCFHNLSLNVLAECISTSFIRFLSTSRRWKSLLSYHTKHYSVVILTSQEAFVPLPHAQHEGNAQHHLVGRARRAPLPHSDDANMQLGTLQLAYLVGFLLCYLACQSTLSAL